jgi:hypothetical protein
MSGPSLYDGGGKATLRKLTDTVGWALPTFFGAGATGGLSTSALLAILLLVSFPISAHAKPISLHPDNPHYLFFRGKPTILIGSTEHYGAVLNWDIDYSRYLYALEESGLNVTRTFSGAYMEADKAFNITNNTLAPKAGKLLCPWARSETPGYANGGNKFDLTKWDERYFHRLKNFVNLADKRGIIVEMVLFCPYYEDSMWNLSPLNAANNVNGVGTVKRTEANTLKNGNLLDVQLAMVKKIVSELNEFDNVYYEICNEPYFGGVTLDWQAKIAETIVAAEADLPNKHLIAQNIANGKQKIENANPAVSIFNFHYATPPDTVAMNYGLNKVIGDDETGFKGTSDFVYRKEAWDFILAGGAIYDNLDYSFTADTPDGTFQLPPKQPGGGGVALRTQLSILRKFIGGFDYLKMTPDNSAIVGGVPAGGSSRVLTRAGQAYAMAIYIHGGKQANLTLHVPEGKYKVEWVNTLTGKIDKSEEVETTGDTLKVSSPSYEEDIAVRIRK